MASKSTATVGKSGYALGIKRTQAEWDELFASTILPTLRNGATVQSQREQYGRSEEIRQAARRAGYMTIADAIRGDATFTPIKVKGVNKAVLAKRINEARTQGQSWNTLRLRTTLAKDELLALLKAHGYTAVTSGRVLTTERSIKAAAAKAAAEAAVKPARKRTRKPKVAVTS